LEKASLLKLKYITGRGGDALAGLSEYLTTLTSQYKALAIDPEFLSKDFHEQVLTVKSFCSADDSYIIANSYGAYLLLHSLIDEPPIESKVMLLSPVLGRVNSEKRMLISRPPGEKALKSAILEARLGLPEHLEILTGSDDEICDSSLAEETANTLGVNICVLQNEGHMITPSKVMSAIQAFLSPYRA
jgi:predicted alpha/beta hydrolase family esterase